MSHAPSACPTASAVPWQDTWADKERQVAAAAAVQLIYMGDLNDGLARERDAPQLRARGRSIVEPAVQQLYRKYMLAVDRKLTPQVLGLVAECNLIRAAAPHLYPAVRQAANDTAADLRAAGSSAALMASVQVETSWARLGGNGVYGGIETDFADFPFIGTLGFVVVSVLWLECARGHPVGLLPALAGRP